MASKAKGFVWHVLTEESKRDFPRNETFILFDENATSGGCIFEAMAFDDGSIGDPGTLESYDLKDFTHWSRMPELPKKEVCSKCKREV